jgi:hypothetical protein
MPSPAALLPCYQVIKGFGTPVNLQNLVMYGFGVGIGMTTFTYGHLRARTPRQHAVCSCYWRAGWCVGWSSGWECTQWCWTALDLDTCFAQPMRPCALAPTPVRCGVVCAGGGSGPDASHSFFEGYGVLATCLILSQALQGIAVVRCARRVRIRSAHAVGTRAVGCTRASERGVDMCVGVGGP